jgi:hypothetical protein
MHLINTNDLEQTLLMTLLCNLGPLEKQSTRCTSLSRYHMTKESFNAMKELYTSTRTH